MAASHVSLPTLPTMEGISRSSRAIPSSSANNNTATVAAAPHYSQTVPPPPGTSESARRRTNNGGRHPAGAPPLVPERAQITSWPARSGRSADVSAGPVLSLHLAKHNGPSGDGLQDDTNKTNPSFTIGLGETAWAASAAAASRRTKPAASPLHTTSTAGASTARVRPAAEPSSFALPHLQSRERPWQTARISTAAAVDGQRSKPPLVLELEAFIRRELHLIGQREERLSSRRKQQQQQPSAGGFTRVDTAGGGHGYATDDETFPPPPHHHRDRERHGHSAALPAPPHGHASLLPSPPGTASTTTSVALVPVSRSVVVPPAAGNATRAPKLHTLHDSAAMRTASNPLVQPQELVNAPLPAPGGGDSRLSSSPRGAGVPNSNSGNAAYGTAAAQTTTTATAAKLPDDHTLGSAVRAGSAERLVIFSEAYNVLARHLGEYEDLMITIKSEFDAAIRDGEKQRRHARELERELGTAHGYVSYIVEAETTEVQKRLLNVEAERDALKRRITQLEAEAAAAIDRRNHAQFELERAQVEIADGHQRNKLLSDALRSEAERQAAVVANLNQLRRDNERLQQYARAMEDKARDDAIVIEELSDAVKASSSGPAAAPRRTALTTTAGATPPPALGSSMNDTTTASAASPVSNATPALAGGTTTSGTSKSGGGGAASSRFARAAMSVLALSGTELDGASSAPTPAAANFSPRSVTVPASSSSDVLVDTLEQEVLRARGQARKYHRVALTLQRTVQQQRKKLDALLARRGDRPSTPRPDWASLSKLLPDFNPSPETTSDQVLFELKCQIDDMKRHERREVEAHALSKTIQQWLGDEDLCESDLSSAFTKTFVGLGTGPNVPPLLRIHGRVRNKRLSKGDVERLLKQFWRDREARRRAEGTDRSRVTDFALEWLTRTTGSHAAAIELAYNMLNVCELNRYDPDCSLFADIMNGKLCEDAIFESNKAIEQLQRVIQAADKKSVGVIKRTQMFRLLRRLFPGKPHEHMLKLRFALVAHSPEDGIIRYLDLFDEDINGNQTRFVEYIRQQHVDESIEFVVDVEEEIRASATSGDAVTIAEARGAIRRLDAHMPEIELVRIVAAGFGVSAETLANMEERAKVDLSDFFARMRQNVFVKRYTPKPAALAHVDRGGGDDYDPQRASVSSMSESSDGDHHQGADSEGDNDARRTAASGGIVEVPALDADLVQPDDGAPLQQLVSSASHQASPASPL